MKIKEYINKIVENGNDEDMEELSDILEEVIYKLRDFDEKCYDKYKTKMMGLAYNYKFDEDMAMEIVEDMEPLGEFWDMNTTTNVKNQYGIKASDEEFYVVMNSLANDYGNIIDKNQVQTYARLADAFINDEDAKDKKVWIYFTKIPKED